MRIAYIAHPRTANGFYRGVGPMEVLAQRGHEVRRVFEPDGRMRFEVVAGVDVLYVHRFDESQIRGLMRDARKAGIAVVWDNDDNLFEIPKTDASYREHGGYHGHRALSLVRRILSSVTTVTTPSAVLAEAYRAAGATHVCVIENYLPDDFLGVVPARPSGCVIGWTAGREHAYDARELGIADALVRLLERHDDVQVQLIGIDLGIAHARYQRVAAVDFPNITQCAAHFHVGIAPVADIAFNRARSNVKLKEYACAGIPWLASPVGPYAEMGEAQGGRLVADGDWYGALERLVRERRARRKLGRRAAKWVQGETIAAHADRWEAMLADAIVRARTS